LPPEITEYSPTSDIVAGNVERRGFDIPRELLERLSLEGYTDKEIAQMFGVPKHRIALLRRKYGINKRELAKHRREERLRKVTELIEATLRNRGYITSAELKEWYGIKLNRRLLQHLESSIEGFMWFKLKYISTRKYTVFPLKFLNLVIMYLRGRERDVRNFLLCNKMVLVPTRIVKNLLRANGAPADLIRLFY